MKRKLGFTLIELVIFIVLTGIVWRTILMGFNIVGRYMPAQQQQIIATQTATQCMEWFLGQRYIKGFSSIPCPSVTTPSFCTALVPVGYTISTMVAATTIGGDSNYKTVKVKVTGLGTAALSTLFADY